MSAREEAERLLESKWCPFCDFRTDAPEFEHIISCPTHLLRALLSEVRELRAQQARYENAQCITCGKDLDASLSSQTATEDASK